MPASTRSSPGTWDRVARTAQVRDLLYLRPAFRTAAPDGFAVHPPRILARVPVQIHFIVPAPKPNRFFQLLHDRLTKATQPTLAQALRGCLGWSRASNMMSCAMEFPKPGISCSCVRMAFTVF